MIASYQNLSTEAFLNNCPVTILSSKCFVLNNCLNNRDLELIYEININAFNYKYSFQ